VNFRGEFLRALRDAGHDVLATAPDKDPEVVAQLGAMGVRFRRVAMSRAGLNPMADLMMLGAYLRLMWTERPDVVIAYTQKPIIYAGLAARLFPGTKFHVIMSGLGFVFSSPEGQRHALRKLVSYMYRLAVAKAETIFVFNSDDRDEMLRRRIISREQNVIQVPGSGIDTDHFLPAPLPDGPPTMLLIARLMRDKGIYDFIDAARLVRAVWPECRFRILGRAENDNPTGIPAAEIKRFSAEGIVEFLPETRDVRPHLAQATVFVLPSYYREGLPRTILEALSSGRAVITTDLPGCRDAIIEGKNGYLVPPRSPRKLADAILKVISDPGLLREMSAFAREVAVAKYDVHKVNRQLLESMGLAARPPKPVGRDGTRRARSSGLTEIPSTS